MIFPKTRNIYFNPFVPGENSLITNTWLPKRMVFTFISDTGSIGYNILMSKKHFVLFPFVQKLFPDPFTPYNQLSPYHCAL